MGREARRLTKTTVEQLRELDRRQGLTTSGRWMLEHRRAGTVLLHIAAPVYWLIGAIGGAREGHREWSTDRRIWKELGQ